MSRSSSSKDQSLPFYMNVDVVQSPRSPGGSASTPGRSWGSASGVSAYPNVRAILPPKTQPGLRTCHICNEEVLHMRGHVLEHNRRPDGIYYCPICSFRTPLSGENTRHAEEHEKYEKALKKRRDAESSGGWSSKRPGKTSQAQPQTSEAPSSSPSKTRRSGQKPPEASNVTFISSTNVASAAMAAALPPLSHTPGPPGSSYSNSATTLPSIRSFSWYHHPQDQREPEQLDRASLRLPPISDLTRRR
ncbi:hypothetical protein BDZ89DRAFT_1074344 [Hymenopellis radicata]|nr:hypothetical protein BDZ89DRAFT_1074344 [Hymenopellis radicata]